MESEREAKRADEEKTCGCYVDWDLKEKILCDKHQSSAQEMEAEYERWVD